MRRRPKSIPPKFLYDERGSALFERICELEEYYPTRTEIGILGAQAEAIARRIGPACQLIEYGSGSSIKTRLLLDERDDWAAYVPIDISREHLLRSADALRERYPGLEVLPVCGDAPGRSRRSSSMTSGVLRSSSRSASSTSTT